ncbi:HEPN domain-containing protein [Burkholderia ambifaria]|jgi:hypothetical protein|uniref:HEPN domain-containing protein n=1 Tax=Burkholderia ambifaria TaxID=152480 RepID=UPI001B97CE55|nr:HEPN domain-containing protein [Burkholderia ambifaria]MBR8223689.1 hypothetical protein [Burkholderia ambifaria]
MKRERKYKFPGDWAFVAQPMALSGAPFELADGIFLRRAADREILAISRNLKKLVGSPFDMNPCLAYEFDVKVDPEDEGEVGEWLFVEDYRYSIVERADDSYSFFEVDLASLATNCPLHIGFMTFRGARLGGWNPGIQPRFFDFSTPPLPIFPTHTELVELRDVVKLLIDNKEVYENEYPEINRAFRMYKALSYLPRESEFEFIGLFAIIEMLITHNPKLEDRGDSITHQMQSKLPLLMRRFSRGISASDYFNPQVGIQKIWSALYAYRSALAHGGVADFERNLQVIKSPEVAKRFLDSVVRGLLRHVLVEPQLFKDLRGC